jgi:hypothetical protein
MRDIAVGENGRRANPSCVEGLDPPALAIRNIDGKPLPLAGDWC